MKKKTQNISTNSVTDPNPGLL